MTIRPSSRHEESLWRGLLYLSPQKIPNPLAAGEGFEHNEGDNLTGVTNDFQYPRQLIRYFIIFVFWSKQTSKLKEMRASCYRRWAIPKTIDHFDEYTRTEISLSLILLIFLSNFLYLPPYP